MYQVKYCGIFNIIILHVHSRYTRQHTLPNSQIGYSSTQLLNQMKYSSTSPPHSQVEYSPPPSQLRYS